MLSSPTHPRKTLTLAAVCLGTFMLIVDVTIVVVALPSIRTALHTSLSDQQWTIDAYTLSPAALLLPAGSLGDILGRRRVFAAGLLVFTVGSLLCGVAGSGAELVAFRALQRIGGAMVFVTALALLAQTFHGPERGMAFGVWGVVVTLGLTVGPVLGGLLTTELSWRWIFFVNIPVGMIAMLVTLIGVQESRPPRSRRIDVPGFIVFTLGLLALVYGLIESGPAGWGATRVIAAFAVAVVALAAFPMVERQRREPMFDLALLRKPTFVGGLIAAFGMNGSLYAMFLYFVLYLQNGLHYSALATGVRLLVITGGSMLTSIPAGRLSERIPARWLIGPGLLLVGLGLLLMRGLSPGSDWTHLILGFAIAGAGSGMVNPPLASTAVGVVSPQDAGMASGINSTFRQIGIATALAALGSVFAAHMSHATPTTLTAHYSSSLNAVLLITACVAFTAGVLAIVLIRTRDFEAAQPFAEPGARGNPSRQPEIGTPERLSSAAGRLSKHRSSRAPSVRRVRNHAQAAP
jgi:EmrB/QacA subfamily drug resistance transporter